MSEIYYMDIAFLIWGSIFSMIAALCMFLSKNYNREKRRWMLCMQITTAVLLMSDALATMFDGCPGAGYTVILQIGNFLLFALINVILLFFHEYVICYLFAKSDRTKIFRIKLNRCVLIAGIILSAVSPFLHLYYLIDAQNIYHRSDGFFVSLIVPVLAVLVELSLLIQYRKNISKSILGSMIFYMVFPLSAMMIQIRYYGLALINMSIGIAMILMFVMITKEQNHELENLIRSREETAERLEISTMLNRCVTELTSGDNIDQAIQNLLGIINDYFDADRTYIFRIDPIRQVTYNTYECTKEHVSRQIDNLQEIPLSTISTWMKKFEESKVYYVADLEQEKGTPTYEILAVQNIDQLLAVPLSKDNQIIGFMGVDNPRNHNEDATLLSSLQFFITNSLMKKKEKEYLRFLSYRDMLTGLYNRNRYMETVNEYQENHCESIGVAFIDLNGLKKINDWYGHEAGDRMIRKTASCILQFFPENSFRIGGDEFVIVIRDVKQQEFEEEMQRLRSSIERQRISISMGMLWRKQPKDLEDMLKQADALMYEEKEAYYRINGNYHGFYYAGKQE